MGAIERITVTLPAEMAAALRSTVEGGEYATTSEIVREALRDWAKARDADRRELEKLRAYIRKGDGSGARYPLAENMTELRAMIQEGIDSGPGIPAEEVYAELYEMIEAKRAKT